MSGTPSIEIDGLCVAYGDAVAVDRVAFSIQQGELATLLGPSGCGKTTTLRAIAGLEDPTTGVIRLNGDTVFDSARRINVPAERRGLSMVFQSYAIWPHMTVAENVAYGLKVRRRPRAEIDSNVKRALDLVQMSAFGDRPASKLSGGQQQRVAVARAIAFSPSVLLFDEPLSNLDAKLRTEMRVELRELQQRLEITSVYVTHDQEEALAISDHVIVMNQGRIEQIDAPEVLYNRPASLFVADFVGAANLIEGTVRQTGPVSVFETRGGQVLRVATPRSVTGSETILALRSSHVSLQTEPSAAAGDANVATGTVHRRMFHGDFVQYVIDWPAGQLLVRRPPTEMIAEGAAVSIMFLPEHCVLLGR
ncbi:MAG TPA: ABC transporter ATP-binding protein [Rhodopila sp.]|uniref:ABC transporter ATP-binding protein n=1 Tax=Rhodopila sp. TaxID=2480087 RepID=UPI002CE68EDE|nr:ABC transporter ATP-binding protein [Rhodopila sp.]HVY14944.1 ABC transporter ATP-binding protein [Rhodopila sp.]